LGHSQCGGVQALLHSHHHPEAEDHQNDFINNWVSLIKTKTLDNTHPDDPDEYARFALTQSYKNCLTFPWIAEKVKEKTLIIHLWFFDIKQGQIFTYDEEQKAYLPLKPIKPEVE
jgi:carbonic anhydrase